MKKFLPYILILTILAGFLGPVEKARAEGPDDKGTCTTTILSGGGESVGTTFFSKTTTRADCPAGSDFKIAPAGTVLPPESAPGTYTDISDLKPATPGQQPGESDFDYQFRVGALGVCWLGASKGFISMEGCMVSFSYYVFYGLGAFLLTVSAKFFNALINISLATNLISNSAFVAEGWTVVRDLSNIFFIIALLYIGIKMILGIGGHDTKKMITMVVVMALLINFSMFMTKVVIDTSNILAVIFYNKMDVLIAVKDPVTGKPVIDPETNQPKTIPYSDSTGKGEKDLAGAMVNSFNPASALKWDSYFAQAKLTRDINGKELDGCTSTSAAGSRSSDGKLCFQDTIPVGITMGILIVSALIMFTATYAFFISGLSFLGRFLELWVLIIFSPFAFMSLSVPFLDKVEYISWNSWFHRLISLSFMAPIFMFFLYFIFLLINSGLFKSLIVNQKDMISVLLSIAIPAGIITILLRKAAEFAKKGSGVIAEKLIKTVGVATGIAGGIAMGGTGALLQATVGQASSRFANSTGAKAWAAKSKFGERVLGLSERAARSDFDARKGIVGAGLKGISAVTGLNLGHSSKVLVRSAGGFEGDRDRAIQKRVKRASVLSKVGYDEEVTKKLRRQEVMKQEVMMKKDVHGHTSEDRVTEIDNKIKAVGEEKSRLSERARLIEVVDPNKVALKNAAIERARTAVYAGPNASADKTAAIASAEAMNVNDPTKVAAKAAAAAAAKKMDDELDKLKTERGNIKGGKEFKTNDAGERIYDSHNTHNGYITAGEVSGTLDEALTAVTTSDSAAREAAAAGGGNAALNAAAAEANSRAIEALAKADIAAAMVKEAARKNPKSAELREADTATSASIDAIRNAMTANTTSVRNPADAALAALAEAKMKEANKSLTNDDHTGAKDMARKAADVENGLGRSINDQDDIYIQKAHHEVANTEKTRMKNYAENMARGGRPWSMYETLQGMGPDEIAEAVSRIRMGEKPQSSGGGKDDGGHFLGGLLSELVGSKLFEGGGHGKSGGSGGGHAPAAPSGGGGGGHH